MQSARCVMYTLTTPPGVLPYCIRREAVSPGDIAFNIIALLWCAWGRDQGLDLGPWQSTRRLSSMPPLSKLQSEVLFSAPPDS